jgi:plasmid stabilization system protein ParE
MARKVMWTESAWRDLEEVADYIADDNILRTSANQKLSDQVGLEIVTFNSGLFMLSAMC